MRNYRLYKNYKHVIINIFIDDNIDFVVTIFFL